MIAKGDRIFWSDAAVKSAGRERSDLQRRALAQADEHSNGSRDWMMHAVTNDDGRVYLFDRTDDGHCFRTYVRLAHYEPMKPLPDDHPDPERRGKIFKVPVSDKCPGNETFVEFDFED
jgi:hypothetical protein